MSLQTLKTYIFILHLILQGNTLLNFKIKKEKYFFLFSKKEILKSGHVNVVLWSEVLGASSGEQQLGVTGWTGGLKSR